MEHIADPCRLQIITLDEAYFEALGISKQKSPRADGAKWTGSLVMAWKSAADWLLSVLRL